MEHETGLEACEVLDRFEGLGGELEDVGEEGGVVGKGGGSEELAMERISTNWVHQSPVKSSIHATADEEQCRLIMPAPQGRSSRGRERRHRRISEANKQVIPGNNGF